MHQKIQIQVLGNAVQAMRHFKIEEKQRYFTKSKFTARSVLSQVKKKGDIGLGEAILPKLLCRLPHSTGGWTSERTLPGNIAAIYPRNELATILHPNKSIAQGFATTLVTMKGDRAVMGFVTEETPEKLIMRDMASIEHLIKKEDVVNRSTLPNSMMPAGRASILH